MRRAAVLSWALLAFVAVAAAGDGVPSEAELRALLAERDDAVARDLLGVVLSRQGRLEDAEAEYQRALELDPDFAEARAHLARLYLLQGREPAAVEHLRAAARLAPLERDLAFKLASVERDAGDLAAAARQLASVADRFDSARALMQLGQLEAARGRLAAACEHLSRATELAPSSEDVLASYARASVAARDPVPAILALEPLMRMVPSVAEYPYLMGIARIQAGDAQGALEALEKAREVEPRRALTLVALGLALNQQKRYAEAGEMLLESLKLAPDNVEGLTGLAEAEVGLDDLDAAETHVRRALAAEPRHPLGNLVLGMVTMRRGRFAEAAAALERAVELDPESPKAHYQLSLAYSRLGDREGHRKHLALYRQAYEKNAERLRQLSGSQQGGM